MDHALNDCDETVTILLQKKSEHKEKIDQIYENCEKISDAVMEKNLSMLILYGGALISVVPMISSQILLSSLVCVGGILFFNHKSGWKDLKKEIRKYSSEYESVELIHCDGLRLCAGRLHGNVIFDDLEAIPFAIRLKILELVGGEATFSLTTLTTNSIIPSTTSKRGNAVVPSSGRPRICGVANTEEFKAYQGDYLRTFTASSFVLLVVVGLTGWNCLMAANGGGKGVKLNGGVKANGAARPSGGVFKNFGIKFPPWVCGQWFQSQDD